MRVVANMAEAVQSLAEKGFVRFDVPNPNAEELAPLGLALNLHSLSLEGLPGRVPGDSVGHRTTVGLRRRSRTRQYGTLSLMTAPTTARPGRNQPCHCGSGRKYKQCCLTKDDALAAAARAEAAAEAAAPSSEAATPDPARTPRHQTHQPWKAMTSRGFVPRTRMPRKVGGG
jgi:hypothetical protein